MSLRNTTARKRKIKKIIRLTILTTLAIGLFTLMAVDTKVVKIGSDEDKQDTVFSAKAFGQSQFPEIQQDIERRAVDASVLATAILEDKKSAGEKYGVAASIGAVMPIKLTGMVGEGKSGIYDLHVDGLPETIRLRVQTGPAINGTDLRDATGKITFGQFTNQIEYQDAGAALNNAMKETVLAGIDNSNLTGKTLVVVGVFKLINPKNWLITPVRLSVQ